MMEFLSDKERIMEFDLQDDNTSCSSSLSATISEDIDDLRLGAEANMFLPKYEPGDVNGKRKPVQNFVIVKERTENSGHDDPNYTFSTISSISDLLEAREGNPEDILLGLGFASLEEESHNSILLRFQSSPEQRASLSSIQRSENDKGHNIRLEAHDGIVKTQEWLNSQQIPKDSSPSPTTPKEGQAVNKTNGYNQGKRLTAQKKRLRWSKSRQSSFEHLLPNLEEEETPGDQVSDGSSGSQKENKPIAPIRESSQEKEEKISDNKSNSAPSIHDKQILIRKLCELEKQQSSTQEAELNTNGDLQPVEKTGAIKLKSSQTSETTVKSAELGKLFKAVENSSQLVSEPSPLRLSPWKHLNRKNLVNVKVDSFELEEIVSNDGRQSPNVARSSVLCDPVGIHPSPLFDCSNDYSSGNRSNLSTSSSDSSSGFDEGLEDLTSLRRNSKDMSPVIPLVLKYGRNFSEALPLSQKMHEFCLQRAKIACASGIAEYALLRRKEKNTTPNPNQCNCMKSTTFTACSSSQSIKKSSKIHPSNLRSNSKLGVEFTTEQCRRVKSSASSPKLQIFNSDILTKQNFNGKSSCHPLTSDRKSLMNTNNVNNNSNSVSGQEFQAKPCHLIRFSSMPSLHFAASPVHRKRSSQNSFREATNLDSDASLMSSISSVTYLSYWSSTGSLRQNSLKAQESKCTQGSDLGNKYPKNAKHHNAKMSATSRRDEKFRSSTHVDKAVTNAFLCSHNETVSRSVESLVHLKTNDSSVR